MGVIIYAIGWYLQFFPEMADLDEIIAMITLYAFPYFFLNLITSAYKFAPYFPIVYFFLFKVSKKSVSIFILMNVLSSLLFVVYSWANVF